MNNLRGRSGGCINVSSLWVHPGELKMESRDSNSLFLSANFIFKIFASFREFGFRLGNALSTNTNLKSKVELFIKPSVNGRIKWQRELTDSSLVLVCSGLKEVALKSNMLHLLTKYFLSLPSDAISWRLMHRFYNGAVMAFKGSPKIDLM